MSKTESPATSKGSTTIAPTVLATVTRLTALAVPGVARLAPIPGGVNRLFRRGANEGIRLDVTDSSVSVELYLVLLPETSIREVARRVQADVARAIEETVGMRVTRIDVHVEDVDYGTAAS
ncbi:MAG TPA: Asp23/Gls24 family envelope stress response protein [Anaerolineales bacterium]|nr:Asp23/Gls24 family envelope stress response protein [Anaerolineales bacterium]